MTIAYFSAEFGLDESLPIYSGGLGILAGDHVKAANDIGISLMGVGVLYRRGYFQQRIHHDGSQEALYPVMDPNRLPVKPVLNDWGDPLFVGVPVGNRTVFLKVWCAEVGKAKVYLMDSDIDRNSEADRRLTDRLYGGDQNTRICHEIILGIGGVRVLRALGVEPDVWHMNEGHVAFLTLERIREYSAQGIPFDTALEAVRANTVFTTHTPVPAGHDVFSFELLDRYLSDYYWQLGEERAKILGLGRIGEDQFNMTRLAIRTSSRVNGVSKLHAQVSKELFHQWTPQIPAQDIPVTAITNGIHTGTWAAPEMKELFTRFLSPDWESQVADPQIWNRIEDIPDQELWDAHIRAKQRMIERLGLPISQNELTIGFARRFATYKRAALLFADPERLDRIVNHPNYPVCIIYAGKAHPNDYPGQDLIRTIKQVSLMERFKNRIFLVENYDIKIASHLVQGVDVWLNTPLKPMEASGTSGMKAAVNGVLNCSVLDGWWSEAFNGRNGWGIEGAMSGSREERDQADREAVYRLLEEEISPLYYDWDDSGISPGWIAKVKESIRSLAPVYNTNRMVAEYRENFYQPLAERGRKLLANRMEAAARVAAYKRFIRRNWQHVEVQSVELSGPMVQAVIHLGPVWNKDVRVEAVGSNGYGGLWKQQLDYAYEIGRGIHLFQAVYGGTAEEWIRSNANVRVFPVSPEFADDFEMELVAWGRK
ncbi:alpha-glucan family phosphorylase [Effusibacillus consociatus]|uniref:Alpha-glucan family phosphorylase n=1 Tax=Effusibacillus consociatus TaxID=1117041 RepID=A0ABV9Q015_9BACL